MKVDGIYCPSCRGYISINFKNGVGFCFRCGSGYVYPRGFGETEEDREKIVQWLINLVDKYEREQLATEDMNVNDIAIKVEKTIVNNQSK